MTIAAVNSSAIPIYDYTVGKAAKLAETRKLNYYKKQFMIDPNCDVKLFIFAVESNGALGPQAIQLCQLLAGLSRLEYSHAHNILY